VLWYRGGLVFKALVSLSLRLKEPVTRVKKKKSTSESAIGISPSAGTARVWQWGNALLVSLSFEDSKTF